jgi:2-(1,2-epoxy-1,2-dihydrophenyl)acetyl-CoA isomerase
MVLKNIILTREESVATITLNRSDTLNALDLEVAQEVEFAIKELEKDKNIRVGIITGAGRAFCSGGNLKVIPKAVKDARAGRDYLKAMHKMVLALVNLSKPLIAAVNGHAVGAGCNLALLADIIIASDKAKFSEIFVKVGAIPDLGGLFFLPRFLGLARAKELIFLGDIIDAREAERIGLINKVVPHEELKDITKDLARRLAKGPPLAIAIAKNIIQRGLGEALNTILDLEAYGQGVCFESQDYREGVRAFFEKREPRFVGK